ncbi:MAG TPA: hypothetical protein VN982_01780 [Candidatus Dormibacteraeota bacterium]|nr:hypothetical protein [Candidatus Dormibacteraeota bacterium]
MSQVLEICGYNVQTDQYDLKQNYDIDVVQSESIGAACGHRVSGRMIGPPAGTRIWIAAGVTKMRLATTKRMK